MNRALEELPVESLDVVIIENVGNLVCPSAFELGEDGKIVVLSVAEGDDKPVKYPGIFAKSKVLLVNKIDLLKSGAQVDFDLDRVYADARRLNQIHRDLPRVRQDGRRHAELVRLADSIRFRPAIDSDSATGAFGVPAFRRVADE